MNPFVKKAIILVTIPTFLNGCMVTQNTFSLKPRITEKKKNITTLNDFHNEIKCFGDLSWTYHEWHDEVDLPDINKKYNITILPITNQTSGKDDSGKEQTLPVDLGLVAQNIASQLGIKYNVVYVPSIKDMPAGHNIINDFLSERSTNVKNNELLVDSHNITIIAAITEYDIVKNVSPSGNIDSRGSLNGKSLSMSYSKSKDSYQGRITMVFNTAFFDNVNGYSSNKLIYNPNTFTKVSINFEDQVNQNKIGFSFNGSQPSLGYSYSQTNQDSRYAALDLLVERGLLQVLGKHQGIPYWRCMSENQINNHSIEPKSLEEARKMYGYDSDVEARVRRTFLYAGNNLGLGRYKFRAPALAQNEKILYITQIEDKNNNQIPTLTLPYKPNAPVYPLIVTNLKDQLYQQKLNELNKTCNIIDLKNKLELYKNQNLDQQEKIHVQIKTLQTDIQECYQKQIKTFQELFSDELRNQKFSVNQYMYLDSSLLTQISFLHGLQSTLEEKYLKHPNLVGNRAKYTQFFENLKQSNKWEIDKFVTLWMSAPYLKNARIYPFYVHPNPDNKYYQYPNVYTR